MMIDSYPLASGKDSMVDRYEGAGEDDGSGRQLSAIQGRQLSTTPLADAGAVKVDRPPALVGLRIPSRSQHARNLVVALYQTCGHLGRQDLWTASRWADLAVKYRRLAEYMDRLPGDSGLVTLAGEPRKLLSELRALAAELLRHEAALGITPSSRAALGADLGRWPRSFADSMQAQREGVR